MKENDKDYPYNGVYNNIQDLMKWFKTHYGNMIQPRYLYNQKLVGLQNTNVYIESEFPDGSIKTGIGIVYDHFIDIKTTGQHTRWLLTTKNTIEGAHKGSFIFRDSFGKATIQVRDYYYDKGYAWVNHPDDRIPLVAIPYASADTDKKKYGVATLQSLHTLLIPNEKNIEKIDSVEDVIFFDHLQGLGNLSWTPIIRKAITSTPFEQEQGYLPIFLIDGHITPSSIGSPVLLIKNILQERWIFFLGIIIENFKAFEPKYPVADTPPQLLKEYDNIGDFVKSSVIPELIKHATKIYMKRNGVK